MVNEYGESTGVDSPSNVEGSATPRSEASASRQTRTGLVPSKIQQPKPQALPSRSTPSAILVSTRQKGNPILNHIKLLPWEYADIPADYVVGATTCALFLSLKYHRLHPEYIYSRIRLLAGKYLLRILLIMVDIPNHEDSLKELSKTSIINNLTLTLCWSAPEAAHYLELFKSSENSQPTAIRTQQAQSYKESLVEFVTAPRSINKSDAASLISTFGSLQNAINAQPEQISAVPGWGEKKVRQWCSAVREDFRVEASKKTAAPAKDSNSQKNNEPTSRNTRLSISVNAHDEDEEAILAAESEGVHVVSQGNLVERVHPDKAAQQEGMSDGILAALAKLRESGG
ncbi:hypothetical protein BDV24DRAFT_177378 [Aspergillus arachidicola]|uniref:ERCC1-like central domain-containing protein n=1 Tax=Aspergillus arachidicola TaxID=656916 RepID=A0A5N6XX07_9EURO|nr:hypothetical protein BDV24DRAFT_177378 [Aspergillus arachidicola]